MKSENINNTSNTSGEISLKDLVLKMKEWYNYLLSKWFIIVFVAIIGGVLGFTYGYLEKPIYTATTTFVLEEDKGGGGISSLAGLASMAGVDLGGGGSIFQGDNIIEVYKSRTMIQRALLSTFIFDGKRQTLVDRFVSFNEMNKNWEKNPRLKNIDFSDTTHFKILRDSLLGEIVKKISKEQLSIAKPDKKLSIIKVDVKTKDEQFAKAFNNAIVKNVNDFYIQTKTKKSLQNVLILQQKTDSVRSVMNGAIYTAAAIGDATPNLNPTKQVQRVAPIQRSQFSAETNKTILGELVKNLELSKISLRKETPLIQVIDEPIFPLEKQKTGKAKGMMLGVIISGLLVVFGLIIRKMIKNLLN
ncbi:Wzz/FepE/Etk N-terminal domain-containing protein [Pedobacter polysacchareus]|uniref:Wzz/FepE/Etk N-terminal domain-containing protein n=1 Tax=Pedobacter polysacchareus TaxID=2861973 RepID=UPI001C993C0C|nr:Wzz/FepE/Etk N-terminal domain-containing protein [Pedobacter polysacchareus]